LKKYKILSLALSAFLIMSLFSGCKKTGDEYIYLDIKNKPCSVDAQVAETDEELLIVRNIYEGLLRKNDNGEIVNGVCEGYTKNGLEYTFNIRENVTWADDTPLTANDFVFAFRRAVSKNVDAPFVSRLFCIENAKAIHNGNLDVSALGVIATDEKTLTIKLTNDDGNFLNTLTSSICMPCNEAFFNETQGKYGLYADCVLSNGSYRLAKWNSEDFGIRLYKNEKYNGDFIAKNGAVFISSHDEEKDGTTSKLFEKETFDICFADNGEVDSLTKLGAKTFSVPNICWVMTLGNDYSANIRKSFLGAFSSSIYEGKLPTGFTVANSIYPPILDAASANGVAMPDYNLENAKQMFSNEVASLKDKQFPDADLYYYSDEQILPAIRAIMGHYQQNFCAFINMTPAKHPEELSKELLQHSLQFAVFPVVAKSTCIDEYLNNFGVDFTDVASAQVSLLEKQNLIPIAYEDTDICYNKYLDLAYCDKENGYIDFSFIQKEE